MKLIFKKAALLDAIGMVQSSVSVKSTLPILSHLLVHADKKATGTLQLAATDLEIAVRATVKAEIAEEGSITIPAKKFGDLIREMPEGKEIEIVSKEDKRVELKCGKVRASLAALPPKDFPVIPEFPKSGAFKIEKNLLREMIRKTSFAMSTDETRHVLKGVLFSLKEGKARMVATDGRRLAFILRPGMEKVQAQVILPARAVSEIARLLSLDEGKDFIEIAAAENQISFRWKSESKGEDSSGEPREIVLVSRLIEGTFPNYEQVIPKSKELELKLKSSEILSAVKRAALFSEARGGSVRFSLDKGQLRISANAQNLGEEEEELDVDYFGKPFEIAFNPVFLMDVLKNCDEEDVSFEFSSSLNPGVMKPSNDEQYICVIMPMRLQ